MIDYINISFDFFNQSCIPEYKQTAKSDVLNLKTTVRFDLLIFYLEFFLKNLCVSVIHFPYTDFLY